MTERDHFVVAVGFGKDANSGMTYYIIKNSFGTEWGEEGYVRIQAIDTVDGNGVCGSNALVGLPILA